MPSRRDDTPSSGVCDHLTAVAVRSANTHTHHTCAHSDSSENRIEWGMRVDIEQEFNAFRAITITIQSEWTKKKTISVRRDIESNIKVTYGNAAIWLFSFWGENSHSHCYSKWLAFFSSHSSYNTKARIYLRLTVDKRAYMPNAYNMNIYEKRIYFLFCSTFNFSFDIQLRTIMRLLSTDRKASAERFHRRH